jgi:hypothetical protein
MAKATSLTYLLPAFVFACSEVESPTELVPEGPPMLRQVYIDEFIPAMPPAGERIDPAILAFGTHPDAVEALKKRRVNNAVAGTSQRLRIVMDELLLGNHLEEIACRANVDDDTFSRVPVGATPDDIARCAVQGDVLPQTCPGGPNDPMAVCIGDGIDPDGAGPLPARPAGPVGVLDESPEPDGDGASDDTRFINGAVRISCDNGAIDLDQMGQPAIPVNLDSSFWQPSGNQQVAAGQRYDALGPAIVLRTVRGLPTNATCTIKFADEVVDKAGIRPCAPQFGAEGAPDTLVEWPPAGVACPEGDTSGFEFHTEPMVVKQTIPANNATGVAVGTTIELGMNVEVNFASFAGVQISPDPGGTLTAAAKPMDATRTKVIITSSVGFPANTYTVTVPTTAGVATDSFGKNLPTAYTFSFTTN